MGKLIKKTIIVSFIIIMLQVLLAASFFVMYLNDFFSFRSIQTEYIILGSIVIIVVNCLFIWLVCLRFYSVRRKTDLYAAEVIGSDVQEAYNFAMIGLVITNDDDIVIWTNDIIRERHMDIIGENIFSWNKELLQLKDVTNPNLSIKTIINSRNYDIKCLNESGLWIFKDTTEYEAVYKYSREQAPVIGVLAIDNYEDVIKIDDYFNDTITTVKNTIFNYFKEYGVLLKRVKDDLYTMICNFESFSQMKADRFSILDKIREITRGNDVPLTLSIGIAHDFPDFIKLSELANAALDIAMSRGGDQIVVSVYGSEMEFYGGRSEAQEKRNRVRTRVLADSLISLLKNAKNVLIMGHTGMDMDAFGACLGIKSICDRLNLSSRIVADFKNIETKTRSAMTTTFQKEELEKLIVSSRESFDYVDPSTLLVVVDVHAPKMVMCQELLEKCNKIVVIDHHRRAEEYIENPVLNHIDAAASSTCEIITEFIRYSSINPKVIIPANYATIMLSGIFLDSSYFKNKSTGIRTFEASSVLKEYGADNSKADDFLKDDFEEHVIVNELVSHLEHPEYGVCVAYGNEDTEYDFATLSKAANLCMTYKGVHAAFVIGKINSKDSRISARSDGSINVQILMEKLGGGGHYSMAAATIEKTTVDAAKNMLLQDIETNLKDASKKDNWEND